MVFQTAAMSRSASSMATSLLAVLESSSMKSENLGNCSSIMRSSVKSALAGSKVTPTSFMSRRQWRSRMPWLPSAMMSGSRLMNSLTLLSMALQAPHFLRSRILSRRDLYLPAASSSVGGLRPLKGPSFQVA